jgi:hypothetical protein
MNIDIKGTIRKRKILITVFRKVRYMYFCALTVISPVINSKARYWQVFKKRLDLNNPKTLNEKLMWLKLNTYNKNPLVIQCADKYAVRKYVIDCGCGETLNELYGVFNDAGEIPWEELPSKFALKWNFGAGFNIICSDKSQLDITSVTRKLEKWGKTRIHLPYSEMQYKYAQKKIICEKYLDTEEGVPLYDYKLYCFNGVPKAILVCMDREDEMKAVFMSPSWKFISEVSRYNKPGTLPDRPVCLDKMLDVALRLSKPFPFVRIDFYQDRNKAVFGEMTFTPACCLFTSQTEINGISMGDILKISCESSK